MGKFNTEVTINQSIEKIWEFWNDPKHITQWYFASDDWECPKASNDLRAGGHFSYTMASKDKQFSFDFEGDYLSIEWHQSISYQLSDGRKVITEFILHQEGYQVRQHVDAETENSVEMQQKGWQNILENFKKHVE